MSDEITTTHAAAGAGDDHDDSLLPARADEPIADPGLPAHQPRPTDVDPVLERRAERQIATLFGLASLLTIAFCVCYFVFSPNPVTGQTIGNFQLSNLTLGLTLGLALLLMGIAAIHWAKKLMGDEEIIEYRHSAASSDEDRAYSIAAFDQGAEESGFGRRKMVRNSMLGSMALLGLPAIVLLRDLGPLPGDDLEHTVWAKGVQVVNDVSGAPIKPDEVELGQLINGEPSLFFPTVSANGTEEPPAIEGTDAAAEKAKAAVILVKILPSEVTPLPGREDWSVDGVLCYSKICTHLGCPISLYEQQTHHLLCPCHQSTFDLADNGKVLFGPAARPLPQLPLMLDSDGYIIAASDFHEPVGPSFWERG